MSSFDLQYASPTGHHDILEAAVASDRERMEVKLCRDILAMPIRSDGSVDKTQIDKIFTMVKVISKGGKAEDLFLGANEPTSRGAAGVLKAMQAGARNMVGHEATNAILRTASSIVTDGTALNSGERAGLWTLFDEIAERAGSQVPLIKIWCAVHRSNLAWKRVKDDIPEVGNLFQVLGSICAFFHSSGVRTRELKEIAGKENAALLTLPYVFEVRFSEYSQNLLEAILRSWRALVLYFKKSKESECRGYLLYLVDCEKLKLICFLADLLKIFSRYQKSLEGDQSTLLDMDRLTKNVRSRILELPNKAILDGWVSSLEKNLQDTGLGEISIHGIDMKKCKDRRRKEHHKYGTDQRNVNSVCNEVALSLEQFLNDRISIDNSVIETLKPFASLEKNTDLAAVFSMIGEICVS